MTITPICQNRLNEKLIKGQTLRGLGSSFKLNIGIKKAPQSLPSSQIIPKKNLLLLASALKNNEISKEEAQSKFIDLVLEKSLACENKLLDFIKDVFSHDPEFNKQLIENLKRII